MLTARVKIMDQNSTAEFPNRAANTVHMNGPTARPAIAAESYMDRINEEHSWLTQGEPTLYET